MNQQEFLQLERLEAMRFCLNKLLGKEWTKDQYDRARAAWEKKNEDPLIAQVVKVFGNVKIK